MQIRDAAPSPIEHAIDCVSTGTSFEIVAVSLDGKGTIANLTLGDYPLVEGVRVKSGIIFDYFGKVRFRFLVKSKNPPRAWRTSFNAKRLTGHCVQDYDFPLPFTASPEVTAKGRRWVRLLSKLLFKTNLRPNPVLIQPRGLAGVAQGFQYMSEGKVQIHARTLNVYFLLRCY